MTTMDGNSVALTATSTITFAALRTIAKAVMIRWSHTYANLSVDRQDRLDLYVLSLVHAVAVVGMGAHTLTTSDVMRRNETSHRLLGLMSGYFIHDTARLAPTALTHPAELLHHVLALLMLPRFATKNDDNKGLIEFVPAVSVLELSTIVLDVMWIFKELGIKDKSVVVMQHLPRLFAILFVSLRLFWFPNFLNNIRRHHRAKWDSADPLIRWCLHVILILNSFWGVLIAKKAIKTA
eukprot:PhM_4_TR16396/c0_g1_i3/m.88278